MKNILLTTALVGFAGAAAADGHIGVTFSATADLGYNDTNENITTGNDDEDGFYSDLDITASVAAELDNGLTAAASINLDDLDGSDDGVDYELSLTSETAGLYYGDTSFAAENLWVSAGDMESDGFSEADGEEALRGEVTFGAVSAQLSYVLANNAGTRVDTVQADASDVDQLSVAVSGDFGNINVVAAYQEESGVPAGAYSDLDGVDDIEGTADDNAGFGDNGDFNNNEIFGLSVGTSFAGADVRLAYAADGTTDEDSIGLQVAYPFGPVTATVYYVSESEAAGDNYGLTLAYENGPVAVTFDYDNDQGADIYGLEGSYDVGNGIAVYAGFISDDDLEAYYVAGTYDLGSGAELLVSFADDEDLDNDEVGANDYQQGTTVQVSFEF